MPAGTPANASLCAVMEQDNRLVKSLIPHSSRGVSMATVRRVSRATRSLLDIRESALASVGMQGVSSEAIAITHTHTCICLQKWAA